MTGYWSMIIYHTTAIPPRKISAVPVSQRRNKRKRKTSKSIFKERIFTPICENWMQSLFGIFLTIRYQETIYCLLDFVTLLTPLVWCIHIVTIKEKVDFEQTCHKDFTTNSGFAFHMTEYSKRIFHYVEHILINRRLSLKNCTYVKSVICSFYLSLFDNRPCVQKEIFHWIELTCFRLIVFVFL